MSWDIIITYNASILVHNYIIMYLWSKKLGIFSLMYSTLCELCEFSPMQTEESHPIVWKPEILRRKRY